MIKPSIFLLLLCALLFSSCGSLSTTPKPQQSRYLTTMSGGVSFKFSDPKAFQNHFEFRVSGDAPSETFATIQYQPLNETSKPTSIKMDRLKPGQLLKTSSANYNRIKNHTNYDVSVLLYSDSHRKNQIDTLNQSIRFSMPIQALKQVGMDTLVD